MEKLLAPLRYANNLTYITIEKYVKFSEIFKSLFNFFRKILLHFIHLKFYHLVHIKE